MGDSRAEEDAFDAAVREAGDDRLPLMRLLRKVLTEADIVLNHHSGGYLVAHVPDPYHDSTGTTSIELTPEEFDLCKKVLGE